MTAARVRKPARARAVEGEPPLCGCGVRVDAEERTGAVWATRDDPRRTRLGSFLRRTSLDELPQLINIIWGEMSFVGPRPERHAHTLGET